MSKEKRSALSTKKPFIKTGWCWTILIILLVAIFPNIGSGKDVSEEKFLEEVRTASQGVIRSADEKIENVALKDGDLCVYVNLSNSDPSPFTMEDLAMTRTSQITDAIFDLGDYDSLWETITIDFGDIGCITNRKEWVESNEVGRYFPMTHYKLE